MYIVTHKFKTLYKRRGNGMFRGEKTRYLIIVMCDNINGEEAADEATKAGVISAGMPGGKPRIRRVANLALQMERVYQ